jgi:hypothetical protein
VRKARGTDKIPLTEAEEKRGIALSKEFKQKSKGAKRKDTGKSPGPSAKRVKFSSSAANLSSTIARKGTPFPEVESDSDSVVLFSLHAQDVLWSSFEPDEYELEQRQESVDQQDELPCESTASPSMSPYENLVSQSTPPSNADSESESEENDSENDLEDETDVTDSVDEDWLPFLCVAYEYVHLGLLPDPHEVTRDDQHAEIIRSMTRSEVEDLSTIFVKRIARHFRLQIYLSSNPLPMSTAGRFPKDCLIRHTNTAYVLNKILSHLEAEAEVRFCTEYFIAKFSEIEQAVFSSTYSKYIIKGALALLVCWVDLGEIVDLGYDWDYFYFFNISRICELMYMFKILY